MAASFQLREPGLDHAAAMPQVTPPQELLSEYEAFRRYAPQVSAAFAERWLARERPFEFRAVDPQDWLELAARPPGAHNWFRAAAPVAADPVLARALLAYASDMTLLDTCLLPHAVAWSDPRLQIASLDHALVVPRRSAAGRLAAVRAGFAGGGRRARLEPRTDLRARWPPDRQRRTGGADPLPDGPVADLATLAFRRRPEPSCV